MHIYGNTLSLASKALDFLWKKESVLSNNLANVETPGYKAEYITFEEELKKQLESAAESGNAGDIRQAIQTSSYRIHESTEASTRADGNNVNADVELMELTKTAFWYQYLLSSVNSDITRLTTVIKGQ